MYMYQIDRNAARRFEPTFTRAQESGPQLTVSKGI